MNKKFIKYTKTVVVDAIKILLNNMTFYSIFTHSLFLDLFPFFIIKYMLNF